MRRPSVGSATTASRADYLLCPGCGCGQLQPPQRFLSRLLECDLCKRAFDKSIVETLEQIVALPKALGKHSCECGHPEMRRLPDGVFHCPACRAEVLPVSIPEPRPVDERRSLAAFERIPVSAGIPDEKGDRRMVTGGSGNGG
jgi:ribosomal protein L37AE/L43A